MRAIRFHDSSIADVTDGSGCLHAERRRVSLIYIYIYIYICAVLQIGRSLVRSQLVSLEFFIGIKSFRSHYGPGVDSASNRNEYQEYFMGVKAAGA